MNKLSQSKQNQNQSQKIKRQPDILKNPPSAPSTQQLLDQFERVKQQRQEFQNYKIKQTQDFQVKQDLKQNYDFVSDEKNLFQQNIQNSNENQKNIDLQIETKSNSDKKQQSSKSTKAENFLQQSIPLFQDKTQTINNMYFSFVNTKDNQQNNKNSLQEEKIVETPQLSITQRQTQQKKNKNNQLTTQLQKIDENLSNIQSKKNQEVIENKKSESKGVYQVVSKKIINDKIRNLLENIQDKNQKILNAQSLFKQKEQQINIIPLEIEIEENKSQKEYNHRYETLYKKMDQMKKKMEQKQNKQRAHITNHRKNIMQGSFDLSNMQNNHTPKSSRSAKGNLNNQNTSNFQLNPIKKSKPGKFFVFEDINYNDPKKPFQETLSDMEQHSVKNICFDFDDVQSYSIQSQSKYQNKNYEMLNIKKIEILKQIESLDNEILNLEQENPDLEVQSPVKFKNRYNSLFAEDNQVQENKNEHWTSIKSQNQEEQTKTIKSKLYKNPDNFLELSERTWQPNSDFQIQSTKDKKKSKEKKGISISRRSSKNSSDGNVEMKNMLKSDIYHQRQVKNRNFTSIQTIKDVTAKSKVRPVTNILTDKKSSKDHTQDPSELVNTIQMLTNLLKNESNTSQQQKINIYLDKRNVQIQNFDQSYQQMRQNSNKNKIFYRAKEANQMTKSSVHTYSGSDREKKLQN